MGHVTQQAFNVTQPNKQCLSDGKRGLANSPEIERTRLFKKEDKVISIIKPTQCFLIMHVIFMKWTQPCELANRRG